MSSSQKILIRDGKIVMRDGKIVTVTDAADCECCDTCGGPWGPGYDTHPNEVTLNIGSGTGSPFLMTRILKCDWLQAGNVFIFVQFQRNSDPPTWRADAMVSLAVGPGYKPDTFNEGPLGDYYSNPDGTGTLAYTVT